MVAGDVMNTGARIQAAAPAGRDPRRRATYRATERVIDYRALRRSRRRERRSPSRPGRRSPPAPEFGAILADAGERRSSAASDERALLPARSRACVPSGSPARDPRRRAGYRQEPARARAVARRGGRRRAHLLAVRAVPAVRGGRHVLGARRDRQGPGRDSRVNDSADAAADKLARRGGRAAPREASGAGSSVTCDPSSGSPRSEGACRDRRAEASLRGAGSSRRSPIERPLVLVFEDLQWADEGCSTSSTSCRPDRRCPAARRLQRATRAARATARRGVEASATRSRSRWRRCRTTTRRACRVRSTAA